MTVRARLQLSAFLSILLAVVIGFILILTERQLLMATNKANQAAQIVKSVAELDFVSNEYIIFHSSHPEYTEESRQKAQWLIKHEALGRQLQQNLFRLEEEFVILTEVRNSYNRILDVFYNLNHEFEKGGKRNEEYIQILTGQLLIESQTMVSGTFRLQELIQTRIAGSQQHTGMLIIVLAAVLACVIAANSILSGRSINNSIQRLHDGINIVSTGKLDYKVGTDRQDEIGQLSRSFDHMTEKLRQMTASRDELIYEVNERKRTEAALQDSLNTLQSILSASPVGICLVESDRILWANDTMMRIFRCSNDRCLANVEFDTLYENDTEAESARKAIEAGMEGEPVIEFDAGFRRFDDTLFPGHVKLSMATDQGRLQRAVYTVTDETWRRDAEVQKLDRQKLEGALALAGGICHEFNQPLQHVSGMLELMMMNRKDDEALGKSFEKMKSSVDRMSRITQRLQGITRVETLEYAGGRQIIDLERSADDLPDEAGE